MFASIVSQVTHLRSRLCYCRSMFQKEMQKKIVLNRLSMFLSSDRLRGGGMIGAAAAKISDLQNVKKMH